MKLKITLMFTMLTMGIYAQWLENFDSSSILPQGWEIINGGGSSTWSILNLQNAAVEAHSGTNVISIIYDFIAHDDYLITPSFEVLENQSDVLSFWVRSRDPAYPEYISVLLSTTSGFAPSDFTQVLLSNIPETSGPDFQNFRVSLADFHNQEVRIAFYINTTDSFLLDLDTVEVTYEGSCETVAGVTAEVQDGQRVLVQWELEENSVELRYGLLHAAISDLEVFVLEGESDWHVENLLSGQSYQFSLRVQCDDVAFSEWSVPVVVTMPCEGVETIPYQLELDMVNLGNMPLCWSSISDFPGMTWSVVDATISGFFPSFYGVSGAHFFGFANNSFTETRVNLISPPFDISANSNVVLEFYYANMSWAGDVDFLQVYYKNATDEVWIPLGPRLEQSQSNWAQQRYTLPDSDSPITLRFEGISNYGYGIYLDGISLSETLSTAGVADKTWKIYPNPVGDVLHLLDASDVISLGIYNLLGQQVLQREVRGDAVQIDVSNLARGTYLLQLETTHGSVQEKLIKL